MDTMKKKSEKIEGREILRKKKKKKEYERMSQD